VVDNARIAAWRSPGSSTPTKIHVGDIILVATGTWITQWVQKKLGFGDRSQWTDVAGRPGVFDFIVGRDRGKS